MRNVPTGINTISAPSLSNIIVGKAVGVKVTVGVNVIVGVRVAVGVSMIGVGDCVFVGVLDDVVVRIIVGVYVDLGGTKKGTNGQFCRSK